MPDPPRYLQRLTRNLRGILEQLRLEEAPVTDPGELFERLQACRRMHFAARVRGRNLIYAGVRPPPSMVQSFLDDMVVAIERVPPRRWLTIFSLMAGFLSSRYDERHLQKLIDATAEAEATAEQELRAATSERESGGGHA